jgi:uracil-DNA glycosylase family 4
MTRWQAFEERWKDGCGSDFCAGASKCLARGSVPCDVLFIGEAPGASEDVEGEPFHGPAGHLLNQIVEEATSGMTQRVKIGFTNIVGCIPREGLQKISEPTAEQIQQCAPRLAEFLALCSPRLVVLVGAVAATWMRPGYVNPVQIPKGVKTCEIEHPAAIIRAPEAAKGWKIQRCIVVVRNAVEDL